MNTFEDLNGTVDIGNETAAALYWMLEIDRSLPSRDALRQGLELEDWSLNEFLCEAQTHEEVALLGRLFPITRKTRFRKSALEKETMGHPGSNNTHNVEHSTVALSAYGALTSDAVRSRTISLAAIDLEIEVSGELEVDYESGRGIHYNAQADCSLVVSILGYDYPRRFTSQMTIKINRLPAETVSEVSVE